MGKHRLIFSCLGLFTTVALASAALAQSSDPIALTDARLAILAKKVDVGARGHGLAIATRMSREFGVSTTALFDERARSDASWGQLMIAYTLAASARGVTAGEILTLHRNGMGWGEVTIGLGFSLALAAPAVSAESQVVLGAAAADGQVARITAPAAAGGLAWTPWSSPRFRRLGPKPGLMPFWGSGARTLCRKRFGAASPAAPNSVAAEPS